MVGRFRYMKVIRSFGYYLMLSLVIFALLRLTMGLPIRDFFHVFSAPLVYENDALGPLVTIQNLISGGTSQYIVNLGAPFVWETSAVTFNWLNEGLFRLGVLLTDEPALIVNIMYILSYPAIGIAAAFALNRMDIHPALAFSGGVLYTYLPFHYMRNVGHLSLSLYFMIPLVCLVSVWFLQGKILRDNTANQIGKGQNLKRFMNKKMVFSLVAFFILSLGDLYYMLFGLICIAFATLYAAIKNRDRIYVLAGAALVLIVMAGFVLQILPTTTNGGAVLAQTVEQRNIAEPEHHGLKIIQMILPVSDHRLNGFAGITKEYNAAAPLVAENSTATLGSLMTIGFLLSLFYALLKPGNEKRLLESELGTMNIFIVLIATIGGFSMFISLAITSVIRAYNRLSIIIAFFSLAVLLLCAKRVYDFFKRKWVNRYQGKYRKAMPRAFAAVTLTVLLVVTIGGVYDQVGEHVTISPLSEKWNNDKDFVARIESVLPEGSMVFELPTFGNNSGYSVEEGYSSYNLWHPLLHSKTLKWSSSCGTYAKSDQLNYYLGSLPIKDMIDRISVIGFNGIYIDCNAYSDDDSYKLLNEIGNIVQTQPIISADGELYFYDIQDYAYKLCNSQAVKNIYGYKYKISDYQNVFSFLDGWYAPEEWGIWSGQGKSEVLFVFPEAQNKAVRVDMDVDVLPQPIGLDVTITCMDDTLYEGKISESGKLSFTIPALCTDERLATIEIDVKNAVPPAELGISIDDRVLGLGVKSIELIKQ